MSSNDSIFCLLTSRQPSRCMSYFKGGSVIIERKTQRICWCSDVHLALTCQVDKILFYIGYWLEAPGIVYFTDSVVEVESWIPVSINFWLCTLLRHRLDIRYVLTTYWVFVINFLIVGKTSRGRSSLPKTLNIKLSSQLLLWKLLLLILMRLMRFKIHFKINLIRIRYLYSWTWTLPVPFEIEISVFRSYNSVHANIYFKEYMYMYCMLCWWLSNQLIRACSLQWGWLIGVE